MDFWDSALRMLSALAVVLALMMVVVAIARRMMGHRALFVQRRHWFECSAPATWARAKPYRSCPLRAIY